MPRPGCRVQSPPSHLYLFLAGRARIAAAKEATKASKAAGSTSLPGVGATASDPAPAGTLPPLTAGAGAAIIATRPFKWTAVQTSFLEDAVRKELPIGGDTQMGWQRVADSVGVAMGSASHKPSAPQCCGKFVYVCNTTAPTGGASMTAEERSSLEQRGNRFRVSTVGSRIRRSGVRGPACAARPCKCLHPPPTAFAHLQEIKEQINKKAGSVELNAAASASANKGQGYSSFVGGQIPRMGTGELSGAKARNAIEKKMRAAKPPGPASGVARMKASVVALDAVGDEAEAMGKVLATLEQAKTMGAQLPPAFLQTLVDNLHVAVNAATRASKACGSHPKNQTNAPGRRDSCTSVECERKGCIRVLHI